MKSIGRPEKLKTIYSWGRVLKKDAFVGDFRRGLIPIIKKSSSSFIPRGNGRSYGDSSLNKSVVSMLSFNKFLEFDKQEGILEIESGVLVAEILEVVVRHGWFLKVTPGTKFITVGGAVAADVHGKNHHLDGCFSESIIDIKILDAVGKEIICSKKRNKELFFATCGGMGLTGIITTIKIQLVKIESKNIKQKTIKVGCLQGMFDAFEYNKNATYSVAWIDCLSSGDDLGKGVLFCGEFSDDGDLSYKKESMYSLPKITPPFLLNRLTIKAFNYFYYRWQKNNCFNEVSINSFFYPLDKISNWNIMYGKSGFLQYQFILPKENSLKGIKEIINKVSESGESPFLCVLKLHGDENKNYLSFPMKGYSLAMDFKATVKVYDLLKVLDGIVNQFGGRIYLAKDSRMSRYFFEKSYHNLLKFKEFRAQHNMNNKFCSEQSRRLGIECLD